MFSEKAEDCTVEQKKLLESLKGLLKKDDITIEYVGSGYFKHCSKIIINCKSYALSIFRIGQKKSLDFYFTKEQGRGNEPQAQFFSFYNGSHKRTAKPFMASVSSEKDDGGYILAKFIEDNHPIKRDIPEYLRSRERLEAIDRFADNLKNGIDIDAGGLEINKKYLRNPITRINWLNFANKLNSEVQIMEKYSKNKSVAKTQKISNTLLRLKNEGIDLCTTDSREIFKNFPTQEEKEIALKLIRIVKKTRHLKEDLIRKGEFEKYQKLLKEDLETNFPFEKYSKTYSPKREKNIITLN